MGQGWRSALKGFFLCSLSVLGIYLVMHFGAYVLVQSRVEHAQWIARNAAKLLIVLCFLYWAVAAFVRSSSVSQSRLVHALAVVGVLFLLLVSANYYFGWADTYCDVLPYPHQGFQISKINECPSSYTFFTNLGTTGFLLIAASLFVRFARGFMLIPADRS